MCHARARIWRLIVIYGYQDLIFNHVSPGLDHKKSLVFNSQWSYSPKKLSGEMAAFVEVELWIFRYVSENLVYVIDILDQRYAIKNFFRCKNKVSDSKLTTKPLSYPLLFYTPVKGL